LRGKIKYQEGVFKSDFMIEFLIYKSFYFFSSRVFSSSCWKKGLCSTEALKNNKNSKNIDEHDYLFENFQHKIYFSITEIYRLNRIFLEIWF
jgi:hypothetical protein